MMRMRAPRPIIVGVLLLAVAFPPVLQSASLPHGTLVGIAGNTGRQVFRTETPGPASLLVTSISNGVVVTERRGCFSADAPDAERATVMVGYDARSGRERWHRAGLVTAGPEGGGWAQLAPGVLPVRNPATGEQIGLSPRTGETLWSRGTEAADIRASTREVLIASGPGAEGERLEGVDRANGRVRWSYDLHEGRHVQLIDADREVVAVLVVDHPAASIEGATDVDASLHLLSVRDGRLAREIPLALTVEQKLHIAGLEVRATTAVVDVGELLAFDTGSGTERWHAPGSLDPTYPPASGVLIVRSGAGIGSPVAITALDPATGRPRWTRDLGASSLGAAVAGTDLVVFGRERFQAIDLTTGRPRWRLEPGKGVAGVAGMSAADLYLAGGCPVTSAD
jgi:outer membrane protein assembly factor BamB